MNLAPPSISLGSQFLTPAKLAWVLNVGETTVADWYRTGQIDHFKYGRIVRFAPEEVLRFIFAYTVRSNGEAGPVTLNPQQMDLLWQRIERLIQVSAQSQESKKAA